MIFSRIVYCGPHIESIFQTTDHCAVNDECTCTKMEECFTLEQYVDIDNCKMLDYLGQSFRLEMKVRNQAFLFTEAVKEVSLNFI